MNLRYGTLLQLLERLHALPRTRRVATESRIKNLSRLGFPNGPKVGSGERAEYGVDQIIQMLVAFELLRHRLPPAAIAEIIRTEWTTIAIAFAEAARELGAAGRPAAGRRLLLVDAPALHEAGKTIRRGELLTTVEGVTAGELLERVGPGWRSALAIDPASVLADAAALMPGLRRPAQPSAFLEAVASLPEIAGDEAWAESGYTRRRALGDALAALRDIRPPSGEEAAPSPPIAARRLAAALRTGGPLSTLGRIHGFPLEAALAVYVDWVDAPRPRGILGAGAAATLVIKARAQTPEALHSAIVETILAEIGTPIQDL